MAELKKVIQGLDCCLAVKNAGTKTCFDCPYREKDGYLNTPCEDYLMADALELLKEYQEKQEALLPVWQDRAQELVCKKCGGIVWQEDNYCSKCGQAVKWE